MDQQAPRDRELLRIGAVGAVVSVVLIGAAVPAFFAWPPIYHDPVEEVFALLRDQPFEAFMALDPGVLIGWLVMLPVVLGLYAGLRRVDAGWALAALALGILGIAVVVPSRPIMELYTLAEAHGSATTEAARAAAEAAGQGLLAAFEGTAWALGTVLLTSSFLTSSVVMLRSPDFAPWTARLGVIMSVAGLLVFIPVIGPAVALLSTVGGLGWLGLLARDLFGLHHRTA